MVDRISTLPDEILCHILSFLPTQNVVATSFLSKRWRPLWRSVPTLYFDDEIHISKHYYCQCIPRFIYATILARDAHHTHHQPITSFRLRCGASYLSDSSLDLWVNTAAHRGLENLHIEFPYTNDPLTLSNCILSCKTLVVLNLTWLSVDLLSSVDLPKLKTLHLNNVSFSKLQCLVELLSGCPILEDMQLRHISYLNYSIPSYENFKISSKLVRADIYVDFNFPLKAISNVESLVVGEYLCDIPVVFPNLTHVELMWECPMNWDSVILMLRRCPKLQNFGLNIKTSSAVVSWISPYCVPECLSSQLRKCSITNYEGTKSELHFAKYILQHSGVLRTMTIDTAPSSKLQDKFEMIKVLSSLPRSSTICELLFK